MGLWTNIPDVSHRSAHGWKQFLAVGLHCILLIAFANTLATTSHMLPPGLQSLPSHKCSVSYFSSESLAGAPHCYCCFHFVFVRYWLGGPTPRNNCNSGFYKYIRGPQYNHPSASVTITGWGGPPKPETPKSK